VTKIIKNYLTLLTDDLKCKYFLYFNLYFEKPIPKESCIKDSLPIWDWLNHKGSISSTSATFKLVAPQSVRIQSSCQYLFTLLGSARAKGALRTLMKLTLDLWVFCVMAKCCLEVEKFYRQIDKPLEKFGTSF